MPLRSAEHARAKRLVHDVATQRLGKQGCQGQLLHLASRTVLRATPSSIRCGAEQTVASRSTDSAYSDWVAMDAKSDFLLAKRHAHIRELQAALRERHRVGHDQFVDVRLALRSTPHG